MITVDGSMGEGGGQLVRSALTLSLATGRAFRMDRIRSGRDRPGLRAQHLAAVGAAAEIGAAEVEGAELGGREITFRPGRPSPGGYRFRTGTAGSAVLVAQTVLPALAAAGGESTLLLEGGTHNPSAPPFEFFNLAYLRALRELGAEVEARLERPGFYPAGGGRFRVRTGPTRPGRPLELTDRGAERGRRGRAIVSALPRHIAERELSILHAMLELRSDALEVIEVPEDEAVGPGNAVMAILEFERTTEVFTGFGKRGTPAEEVAAGAARRAREWLSSGAPVGPHLADQLLVPMALTADGRFVTSERTSHARTQSALVGRFLDVEIRWSETPGGSWSVEVLTPSGRP